MESPEQDKGQAQEISGVQRAWRRLRELCARLVAKAGPRLRAFGRWLKPILVRGWSRTKAATRSAGAWLKPRGSRFLELVRERWAAGRRVLSAWWVHPGLRHAAGRSLRMARTAAVAFGIAWCISLAARHAVHRVQPGTVGVRQVGWGAGLVEQDLEPGLYRSLPGRSHWHEVDVRTRLVSFAWESEGGTEPALSIVTSDGEAVEVAVSVPYAVRPGEAWQLVASGLARDFSRRVTTTLRRVLVQQLAELNASDWADPDARAAVTSTTLAVLAEELAPCHVEAQDLWITGVYFEPTYEKKMLERQLAGQDARTAAALARRKDAELTLAEVQADRKRQEAAVTAEWDERVATLEHEISMQREALARGTSEHAAAIGRELALAREQAAYARATALANIEDLRDRGRLEAMSGPAGRVLQAAEAVKQLNLGKVTLDPSDPRVPNFFDLDGVVTMLLGTTE